MSLVQTAATPKMFLVLEDDPNDAILIRRAFSSGTCTAFVCRNTSEARAYLTGAGMYSDRERFPFPDLFITDLRLGDESGVKFLEWLRARADLKELPVVVLSGTATPKDIQEVTRLGAARILQKPGDANALMWLLIKLSSDLGALPKGQRLKEAHQRALEAA